jgi:hypothetical protein
MVPARDECRIYNRNQHVQIPSKQPLAKQPSAGDLARHHKPLVVRATFSLMRDDPMKRLGLCFHGLNRAILYAVQSGFSLTIQPAQPASGSKPEIKKPQGSKLRAFRANAASSHWVDSVPAS